MRLPIATLDDKQIEWAKLYLKYGEEPGAATREIYFNGALRLRPKQVEVQSKQLLKNKVLMEFVEELKKERRAKLRMDKDAVLEEMLDVARGCKMKNPAIYEKLMNQINRLLGNFVDEKDGKLSSGQGFTIKIELDNAES